ncbi:transglutaminase domain-containing protein [Clostridium pasteurianum DSM 525 = ATCC 6013]|uniref:Transglutaminase domain-containing protein n=1 Tax=Clostridium pasteurianum DSM 525 = ATCC 6013 TaxID=1262449 RepID=A0A0H3J375_CLOPA|nr:transglutaminase family protein [Clostridium pasteurianum]AJA47914.1 transglutaminase domain-containing protein [Clostridium pasteurianum DSM 525 = ATCC 6013]AJA51902.1 transglutaminase domain-containing protein [Clostridium pasteurianum DSM 525 = ATCC 6013]AOZ75202.1 transglutaminase [Clostridium pasteurianum DSM 525 = ATCC 6013]AOZ78997.1 transglutaminase [Clostridium pasteurianum]ELP59817.1 transglutaminase domain-containing protein [Clostridium pasteurianum DSM 525 = ATCC 6013]
MKRYEFSFITKLIFESNIESQHFMLRCLPGDYQFQKIYDEKITISPEAEFSYDRDSFENKTLSGTIKPKHHIFQYKIMGNALLSRYRSSEILDRIFLYETNSTAIGKAMEEFANNIQVEGNIDEKVFAISNAVHNLIEYVPESTNTKTTAKEAFYNRKGVCQDYSHITIAILRYFKIPARYCVGLMEGEGKTHAWVEYYNNGTWYGIDPTNDKFIEYGYIKISSGRDCLDCIVERGCFTSVNKEVKQSIEISAKVGEING